MTASTRRFDFVLAFALFALIALGVMVFAGAAGSITGIAESAASFIVNEGVAEAGRRAP